MSNNECNDSEVFVRQFEGFRVSSGTDSSSNGKIDFEITTNEGQGLIIYKNGTSDFVVNGSSKEVVGHNLKGEPGKNPVAKVIDAVNGDIYLRATNGTIYIEAANIVIKGADPTQGNIHLQASSGILVNSATTNIQSSDITLSASKSTEIVSAFSSSIVGGAGARVDAGPELDNSSFLSKVLGWITKYKEFLSSKCSD